MQRARLLRLTLLGLIAILAAGLFAPAAAVLEPASVTIAPDDDPQDWAFDDGDVPLPAPPGLAAARAAPRPLPLPTCTAAAPSGARACRARAPPEA